MISCDGRRIWASLPYNGWTWPPRSLHSDAAASIGQSPHRLPDSIEVAAAGLGPKSEYQVYLAESGLDFKIAFVNGLPE
jgi:hypothetical protein